MDLSFLDKSSNVTPLLVRLHDSHKLYTLAKDKKPLARVELTKAISELLEIPVTPRESELIADVLIELMRQAETDLRQALSERLAIMNNVPLRLVLQMANDEIEVADPVLRQSPVLGDLDLIYIIKSQGPLYWKSIAARKTLSEQIINILADTRDFDTGAALASNMNLKLSEHAVVVLSDLSQKSEKVARPLLRREEVTSEVASKIYKFVGEELKKFIVQNYEIDTDTLISTVDDVVLELTESQGNAELKPSTAMLKAAERFGEKGLLTVKLMLGTLRRGQIPAFVAQFSKFTGLGPDTIGEILLQKSGQGLAVACRAHDISKQDFVSIYLLTNRIRNQGRMVDMQDMTRAINYFNRINADVARNIMKNSKDSFKGT
jgi:uncharacterized protein (DUF2336 family)